MNLISVIVIAVIIYLLQYNIYKKSWENGLSVKLYFNDEYVECGGKSELVEVVNNAKYLPLPVFHIKYSLSRFLEFKDMENVILSDAYHRNDAFSVMGNQKVKRTVEFTAKKRGRYGINGVNITARDFFMTKSFARKIRNNSYIYVLPEKVEGPSMDELMSKSLGEIAARNSLNEDLFSVDGIRQYQRTDSFRRINWKATARCDELMVNTYQRSAEYKVMILLNLETNYMVKPEVITELSISLASTAAKKLIDAEIPVAFSSNGIDVATGECEKVTFGSSQAHRIAIDRVLSCIGESAGIEAFDEIIRKNRQKEDVTYLIISSYCKPELISMLDDMREDGKSVYMLVPYLDIHGIEVERDYIQGVEVKLNDT
jgi:uncharacterized protein (DUF58 family)